VPIGLVIRARSSAGEHFLHTEGVTGSIPVAPTSEIKHLDPRPLPSPPRTAPEQMAKTPQNMGGISGGMFGGCSRGGAPPGPENVRAAGRQSDGPNEIKSDADTLTSFDGNGKSSFRGGA
jgi:hypothetical protein